MKKGSGTEGFLFVSIMALEIRLQKDNIGGQKGFAPRQFLAEASGAEEVTIPDNPLDICQLLKQTQHHNGNEFLSMRGCTSARFTQPTCDKFHTSYYPAFPQDSGPLQVNSQWPSSRE